jgi:hypothetical protein
MLLKKQSDLKTYNRINFLMDHAEVKYPFLQFIIFYYLSSTAGPSKETRISNEDHTFYTVTGACFTPPPPPVIKSNTSFSFSWSFPLCEAAI